MRHLALFGSLVVALAVSSVALGAGGIAGSYATTIKSPTDIKGKWVLAFAKGGTYRVQYNGDWIAHGTYSATPTAITFRESADEGCGGTGTYGWKRSGRTLTFTRKREIAKCQIRSVVLRHRFTRVR
jgi:hypothetical protein